MPITDKFPSKFKQSLQEIDPELYEWLEELNFDSKIAQSVAIFLNIKKINEDENFCQDILISLQTLQNARMACPETKPDVTTQKLVDIYPKFVADIYETDSVIGLTFGRQVVSYDAITRKALGIPALQRALIKEVSATTDVSNERTAVRKRIFNLAVSQETLAKLEKSETQMELDEGVLKIHTGEGFCHAELTLIPSKKVESSNETNEIKEAKKGGASEEKTVIQTKEEIAPSANWDQKSLTSSPTVSDYIFHNHKKGKQPVVTGRNSTGPTYDKPTLSSLKKSSLGPRS